MTTGRKLVSGGAVTALQQHQQRDRGEEIADAGAAEQVRVGIARCAAVLLATNISASSSGTSSRNRFISPATRQDRSGVSRARAGSTHGSDLGPVPRALAAI